MRAFARAAPILGINFTVEAQKEFIMRQVFLASQIMDEEVLAYTMQSLIDIVRVAYDNIYD